MPDEKSQKSKVKSQKRFFDGTKKLQATGSQPPNEIDSNRLFSTTAIIELARERGVDFGPGNPQERIRYLIKLGLLPHQIRKSNFSLPTLTLNSSAPVGHLPYWTIDRLKEIDQLLKQGNTFGQIADRLTRLASDESELTRLPVTSYQPLASLRAPGVAPRGRSEPVTSYAIRSILAIFVITISLLALFYIGLTTATPSPSVLGVNTVCPVTK